MEAVSVFTKEELYNLSWQKPVMAQLELSGTCNLKCIHCLERSVCAGDKDLSLEDWQEIVLKLFDLGVRRLDFTGPETFFRKDAIDIISFAKEKGFEIRINTNGTLDISSSFPHVDEMVFSVHGIGRMHDEISSKEGAFGMVENNIAAASVAGVKVSINMSLFKANYSQLLPVFNYFDGQYDLFHFSPTIPILSVSGKDFSSMSLEIDSRLIADYIEKLRAIPAEKLVLKHGFHSIFINDPDHYGQKLALPNCAAGKYKLVVDNQGDVYPCNFFRTGEYCCGNLLTDNPNKIWKEGAGFLKFRNLVLRNRVPSECCSCLKKEKCFSGCRAWSNNYRKGRFYNDKDRRCELGFAFVGVGNNR